MDPIQLWKTHRQFIDKFIATNMQPAIHYLNGLFSAINQEDDTYATFIGSYALKNIFTGAALPENDAYIYDVTNIDGIVLVSGNLRAFNDRYAFMLHHMTELVEHLNTIPDFAGVYDFAVIEEHRNITNGPIYLFEGRIIYISINSIKVGATQLSPESKKLFTALRSSNSKTNIIAVSIELATGINTAACKHFLPVEPGSPMLGWRGYILFSSFLPQWNEDYPVALVALRQQLIYSYAARFYGNELYDMIIGVEHIFRYCAPFYTFRASTIFKEMLTQNNVFLYPANGGGGSIRYADFEEWFNNICLQQIATPVNTNLRYILNTCIHLFDQWLVWKSFGVCVKSGGEALRYYDPIRIISTNDLDAKIYLTEHGLANIEHIYQTISNLLVFINTLLYEIKLVPEIIAKIQTKYTFKFSGRDFVYNITSVIPRKRYNSRIRVMKLNNIRKLFSMDIFAIAQINPTNDITNVFNIKIQASPLDLAFQEGKIEPWIVTPVNSDDKRYSVYYSTTPTGMKISSLGYIRADVEFLLTNQLRILAGKHDKDIRRSQQLDSIVREKGRASDETWLNNPNNKELVEKLDLRNDPLDTEISGPTDYAHEQFKVILNDTIIKVLNDGFDHPNALSAFGALFTEQDVNKMAADFLTIQPSFTSNEKFKTIQDGGKKSTIKKRGITIKKKSAAIKKKSTIKKKSGTIKKKSGTIKKRTMKRSNL